MNAPNLADDRLRVRPYLLTGGRTTPEVELAVDDVLSTTDLGRARRRELTLERAAIVDRCRMPTLLTELAGSLGLSLPVMAVLAGDLVAEGLVTIDTTHDLADDRPDVDVLERLLDGLQSL
ncbi:MAG: DUF742 domain-containing protein [Actinomycetota bacterium]